MLYVLCPTEEKSATTVFLYNINMDENGVEHPLFSLKY